MIPINDLQSKIYQALNQGLDIKVYDEVQENATMPLLSIGNYILSTMEHKDYGYSFDWTLNIYTEYEGKKQVNELVSKTIECMYKLKGVDLDNYTIDDVILNEANINRLEGYYVANLSIRIDLM